MTYDLPLMVLRIEEVGHRRCHTNIRRRLLKVAEEIGEVSEAILGVTCDLNYKNKTREDILEEAIDILIVLIDIVLTRIPGSTIEPSRFVRDATSGLAPTPISFDQFDEVVFSIMREVSDAARAFKRHDDLSFYGSVMNCVGRVFTLVYSPDFGNENAVFDIFVEKMGKWQRFLDRMDEGKSNEAA